MAESQKKRSVGLVILTKIPVMGLVAVLQRRGKFNHEKDWGAESFPGACQVTAHGKLEGAESFVEGLHRELAEELGTPFREGVFNETEGIIRLVDDITLEKEVVTYGIVVKPETLNLARFGPSTGGFDFVTRDGAGNIRNLKEFSKTDGVTDLKTIAMFPDEIEAVQKAFEVLGK